MIELTFFYESPTKKEGNVGRVFCHYFIKLMFDLLPKLPQWLTSLGVKNDEWFEEGGCML